MNERVIVAVMSVPGELRPRRKNWMTYPCSLSVVATVAAAGVNLVYKRVKPLTSSLISYSVSDLIVAVLAP